MSARMQTFGSREEWLRNRRLGGSSIGAVVGLNHWRNNLDEWRIWTGRKQPDDLSDNPLVIYGTKAEEHIRELFALDFPQYRVFYEPNNLWTNDLLPFASASLDGWLEDQRGRRGVLEIKTATINSSAAAAKWEGRIPDDYFAQLIWNMTISESDFGILTAQLKYERDGDLLKVTRHYSVEMADVVEDRDWLIEEAKRFWGYVEADREPPLKLPEF